MKELAAVVLILAVGRSLAGMAFPSKSRDSAVTLFKMLNPDLEWDNSNFLVDSAGPYATCEQADQVGQFSVTTRTPEGSTIGGLRDTEYGGEGHVNAVNTYLGKLLRRWSRDPDFTLQIQKALKFGCSVMTRCNGRIVAACLFSPALDNGNRGIEGRDRAQAFTPEQYFLAEDITGTNWDSSHELENLAGQDIACGMITQRPWNFPNMRTYADQRGLDIDPLYGAAPNEGSTEPAMLDVIRNFGKTPVSSRVGCSLIPDCVVEGQMWVVVSCLYKRS